jgi:hypothetical protein
VVETLSRRGERGHMMSWEVSGGMNVVEDKEMW